MIIKIRMITPLYKKSVIKYLAYLYTVKSSLLSAARHKHIAVLLPATFLSRFVAHTKVYVDFHQNISTFRTAPHVFYNAVVALVISVFKSFSYCSRCSVDQFNCFAISSITASLYFFTSAILKNI